MNIPLKNGGFTEIDDKDAEKWTVNYHNLISPNGNTYHIEDDGKTAYCAAKRLADEINATLPRDCGENTAQKIVDLAYRVILEHSGECEIENLPNEMQCLIDAMKSQPEGRIIQQSSERQKHETEYLRKEINEHK